MDVDGEGTLKKEVRKKVESSGKCGYVAGEGKFENRGQEPQGPKKGPKRIW